MQLSPAIFEEPTSFLADVRLVSWGTGVRWIGWGMAEPLIPVFLFSLLGSYGKSSIVDVVGQIVFVLVLPFAGVLADRISIRRFLVASVLLFFFDGFWAVAALTHQVVFALIAIAVDGAAVASDVIGRATQVRRYAPPDKLASVMGWQNTVINLGFVFGALMSFGTLRFASLPWIFFGIVPTNLLALGMISAITNDAGQRKLPSSQERRPSIHFLGSSYALLMRTAGLRALCGRVLYFNALTGFATLLIPIYAFTRGAHLQDVVLLGITGAVPELFASFLGRAADRYRERLIPAGLGVIGTCLVILGTIGYSPWVLAVIFVLRTVIVLLGLVIEIQVTRSVESSSYGRVSAVFEGLKDVGKLTGGMALGFAMDQLGAKPVFFSLAFVACLLSAIGRLSSTPNTEAAVAGSV